MKNCFKCKIEKSFHEFSKDNSKKDKLSYICKLCIKNHILENKEKIANSCKKYYQDNKEELTKIRKKYYQDNIEKIIENRQYNKQKMLDYIKEREKIDINFKLTNRLRGRLSSAIKNGQKTGSAIRDLGCSISELKTYLEEQFKPGMNWNNYGYYGWHIDHIKLLSKFDLTDRQQFLEACHYTNLQPLWAEENFKKKK